MQARSPKLITAKHLKTWLKVSEDWLIQEAQAGRLPSVNAGDRYLFDPEAVENELLEKARDRDEVSEPIRLVGVQKAAQELGIPWKWIRKAAREQEIQVYINGNKTLVDPNHVGRIFKARFHGLDFFAVKKELSDEQ
jgi:hypothetical protein